MSQAPGSEGGLLAEIALALEPVGEAGKKAAQGDPQALEDLSRISASAQSSVRHGGSERFRLSDADKQMFDAQAAGFASEIDVSETVTGDEEDSDEGETGKGQVVRGGGDPDVGGLSGAVSMGESSYTVVDAGAIREIDEVDGRLSKTEAQRRIRQIREGNPERAKQLQVVESRKVQPARQGQFAVEGGQEG